MRLSHYGTLTADMIHLIRNVSLQLGCTSTHVHVHGVCVQYVQRLFMYIKDKKLVNHYGHVHASTHDYYSR